MVDHGCDIGGQPHLMGSQCVMINECDGGIWMQHSRHIICEAEVCRLHASETEGGQGVAAEMDVAALGVYDRKGSVFLRQRG